MQILPGAGAPYGMQRPAVTRNAAFKTGVDGHVAEGPVRHTRRPRQPNPASAQWRRNAVLSISSSSRSSASSARISSSRGGARHQGEAVEHRPADGRAQRDHLHPLPDHLGGQVKDNACAVGPVPFGADRRHGDDAALEDGFDAGVGRGRSSGLRNARPASRTRVRVSICIALSPRQISARGARTSVMSQIAIRFISGPSRIRSSHAFSRRLLVDVRVGKVGTRRRRDRRRS